MRRALMGVAAAVSLCGTAFIAAAGPGTSAPGTQPGTTGPGDLMALLDQLLAPPRVAGSQIVVPLPLPVTG